MEAPSAESVVAVHREAHEGVPADIMEVDWRSVEGFLGPIREPRGHQPWEDVATRAILYIAMGDPSAARPLSGGGTATTPRHGHTSWARKAIDARGGRHVGADTRSVMGCFSSGPAAIECALAVQQSFMPMASIYEREPLQLRIGVSMGEPVDGRFGLFGAALRVASGLSEHADPGETLVTEDVQSLSASGAFSFTDLGEVDIEGFERPIGAYRLDGRADPLRTSLAATVPVLAEVAPNGLSPREVDVLRLVSIGKTNKEIAATLRISLSTVATHIRNIFAKAGVGHRSEAASFAYRHRLL